MSTIGTATITTRLGDIVVRDTGSSIRATGVRYASADRFAPPEPVQPWPSPLDATTPGPACPQRPSRLDWVTGPVTSMLEQSEDCLTVTVTAPSPVATDAPVMVFFHGGAYVSGSGECPAYDPTTLVEEQAIIVVTVTYRLGLLGNLAIDGIAPANLSLMDSIAALQWVHDNIAAFGGDPGNVTIFGQSAGGYAVYCLLLADGTEGLFRRAIMQSAPILLATGRDDMVAAMGVTARECLGDGAGTVDLSRILECEVAVLAAAQGHGVASGMPFAPQLGRAPLPPEAEVHDRIMRCAARGVEVLVGSTAHDGSPYSLMAKGATTPPFEFVENFTNDNFGATVTSSFARGAEQFAESYAAGGGRVQCYVYGWHPRRSALGACHVLDIPPLLGSKASWEGALMLADGWEEMSSFAPAMRAKWADFARRGLAADVPPFVRIPEDL